MSENDKTHYGLRLSSQERRALDLVAVAKGYKSGADFLRECIDMALTEVLADVQKSSSAGHHPLASWAFGGPGPSEGEAGMTSGTPQARGGLELRDDSA